MRTIIIVINPSHCANNHYYHPSFTPASVTSYFHHILQTIIIIIHPSHRASVTLCKQSLSTSIRHTMLLSNHPSVTSCEQSFSSSILRTVHPSNRANNHRYLPLRNLSILTIVYYGRHRWRRHRRRSRCHSFYVTQRDVAIDVTVVVRCLSCL